MRSRRLSTAQIGATRVMALPVRRQNQNTGIIGDPSFSDKASVLAKRRRELYNARILAVRFNLFESRKHAVWYGRSSDFSTTLVSLSWYALCHLFECREPFSEFSRGLSLQQQLCVVRKVQLENKRS
eukprot:m.138503 g.138503  ORF g.138503 m.138503 type:complete len:127 (+) comp14002_c0_seq2:1833-2213(+)